MKTSPDTIDVSVIESDLLMRQIIGSMMRQASGINLTGVTAFNDGGSALSAIKREMPDVVMLGVPDIKSDQMLLFEEIRDELPQLPIILLTPRSREGAEAAIHGLQMGAADFITKPDQRNGLILATQHFTKRVYPIIRAVPRLNHKRIGQLSKKKIFEKSGRDTYEPAIGSGRSTPLKYDIISVQGCLGAIPTLFELIASLPTRMPVPIMVVQHMPKYYTDELARQLDEVTSLHVREAKNNSLLLPGQVYVAPGGQHAVVRHDGSRRVINLHRGVKMNHCRPSADMFLKSATQAYSGRILGVFLSGGGNDGIEGAMEILNSGGDIILEDYRSAILGDLISDISMTDDNLPFHRADKLGYAIHSMLNGERERKVSGMQLDQPAHREWSE